MILEKVTLDCPHCGMECRRPVGFVQAKSAFVCDRCHEVVRIDKDALAVALARLEATTEELQA